VLAPPDRDVYAVEAYASATLLAILMFLWGAVTLPLVPPVFHVLDLSHVAIGLAGILYFVGPHRRRRAWIGYAYCAFVIVHTLIALPWTTVVWSAARRPFEAVTVPQVAIVSMALIVPRSLLIGLVVMLLFMVEGVFVTVWARHVGVADLLPVGEPYVTIYFAFPAVTLLLLRDQRRRLARRHVRLLAETAALRRLGPVLRRVRDELVAQLAVVSRELETVADRRSMTRAVGRLTDVNERLGGLVDAPVQIDPERERTFIAEDVQRGALVLALIVAVMALAWSPIAWMRLGTDVALRSTALGLVALGVLVVIVATWRRPSELRGRVALLFLFAVTLTVISVDQVPYLHVNRPFTPFLGHKILVVTLGIAAAGWSSMGLPLIVATTVDAVALYYILGFAALKDRIELVEPWAMIIFAVVGLVALAMRDQRRVASLVVLREESAATELHRRATMLLALRDQLNSPLQTLVAGEARATVAARDADVAALRDGIARLVALSRELSQIEVPSEAQVATLHERSLTEG